METLTAMRCEDCCTRTPKVTDEEIGKMMCLKQIHIFSDLTEAELCELSRMTCMKAYSRRDQVYGQNEKANAIYLLTEGRVKVYKCSPGGKELTLTIHEAGEIFGEMALVDDGPRDTIALALADTRLGAICGRDFEMFLGRKPALGLRVIKLIGTRRGEIEKHLENLVFRRAASRLASLLMSLAKKYGIHENRGITLNLKLSHQDLANLIGITRETTTAVLNKFKRLGIIDIRRRQIRILNRCELKKIAERQDGR